MFSKTFLFPYQTVIIHEENQLVNCTDGPAKIKDHRFGGLFIFSIFLMSDIFFDNIHAFDHQSCLPDMRTEPSFQCILP